MDIMRFWAEYIYKPIICTCLRRLEDMTLYQEAPLSLDNTLWRSRINIDDDAPPWFSHRVNAEDRAFLSTVATSRSSKPSRVTSDPHSSARRLSSKTLEVPSEGNASEVLRKRRASPKHRPMVPESEQYNWVLDSSSDQGDHVMIRIDAKGEKLPPIVSSMPAKYLSAIGKTLRSNESTNTSNVDTQLRSEH